MDEFKKYLADQILSEEKIVNYENPLLAIDLETDTCSGHISKPKQSIESARQYGEGNGMRPGTIHATYLIYGIQKVVKVQEDGDVEMTSSPPDVEPLSDEVVTHSLTLVPGDRLKGISNACLHNYVSRPH
ncbi:DNA polymerase delta subunit 3-like protein [Colletotrichum tofieldiae]|nr:DNA polymerase delta subunit 3-like protein [Colletotrichum tofieldiae]GKT85640.1 DNA polymerase delta subunit 3-like protein [Colletotrichum tofieldiae]